MKIRPKIPMLLGGNNIWYSEILDYDPTRYTHAYDTSRLVNPLNFGEAWISRINGNGRGRYTPTPNFSRELIKNIEENNTYYRRFTDALFNSDGTLSDVGKAYARLSDNLLPENSLARVYNGDQIRNSWITTNNDTYGRTGRSFNNVKDYLLYERNDNLPGGRHNVFLDKGKRYFYVDNNGNYHWVNPEDINKYLVSENPIEYGWGDDGVYWEDYELTGLKSPNDPPSNDTVNSGNKKTQLPTEHQEGGYGFDWSKLKEGLNKTLNNPDLWATGRLIGMLNANERIYGEALKGIRPNLLLTYKTHRQVVGDEATKQAYYRRAAQSQTKASLPFTSDADRQMAYLFEAKRVGDELRALGDLADNLEIRRTSDESNQHEWANTQRATEVANTNLASINQANSLRHNLLAQKHSAQWSSFDNFLKGIEYRKRQQLAEDQALEDLIFSLTEQLKLLDDPRIKEANLKLELAIKNNTDEKTGNTNWKALDILDALKELRILLNTLAIESWKRKREFKRNLINFDKSGTKITYKKKDDLLYKSARDVVEHFRKMSKMSSDAQNRKTPRIEKLTSHPKDNKRKYQLGGVAPFLVYTPVSLGGETSRTTSTEVSGSSSKSSKKEGSDTLDMVKELFKSLVGKGLPSDVNSLYMSMLNFLSRAQAFGENISTEDVASMYLLQMLRLNQIQYLKNTHDKAEESMLNNDAMNEFAVDYTGRLVGQKDGEIVYAKSWNDAIEKGINPLTNGQLLHLRAMSPELAGHSELDLIAGNGVGISKIAEFIKANLPKMETTEIEGYTKPEAHKIILGIEVLKNAPDGDYKYTSKELQEQAKYALNYISKILPRNMRTILDIHAGFEGTNTDSLLASLVSSNIGSTINISAVTGKAAKNDKDSLDKIHSNSLLAMLREIGGNPINYSIVTRDSNTKMSVNGTAYPALPGIKNDMSIDSMLSTSGLDQIVLSKQGITFGDQQLNPEDLKDVMYANSGRNAIVTLPCKIVNGVKQVNLAVRDEYEKAELKAANLATRGTNEYLRILGQELKNVHLDSLLDSNGLPDKNMFSEFLIVEAYTTDKINLNNKNSQYIEKVKNPSEDLENRINLALSTDNKKSNYKIDVKDKLSLFELTYNDVYRGTIFIPINNNPAAAMLNDNIKIDQQQDLEELYLISNKSNKYIKDNSF